MCIRDGHSEELGGFPSAIEVTVLVDPDRTLTHGSQVADRDPESLESHRTVIHLPVAEIIEEEEEEETETETSGHEGGR